MFPSSKFYNTGYLPDYSNALRNQQGLPSQFISNMCLQTMIHQGQTRSPVFNTIYYPVRQTPQPDFGDNIPCNAPCVRWLLPP